MNTDGKRHPVAPEAPAVAGENTPGSGEGASTALEALIRKRKQAETPDTHLHSVPPQQPPAPR